MTAEYQREWRKNNPDKVRAYQKKHEQQLSLTIHHIMPLSQGGDDTIKNVAPAHWKCNLSVGNKIPIGARPVVYNG